MLTINTANQTECEVDEYMVDKNPNTGDRKYIIPPPNLHQVSTRKSIWTNFANVCEALHRNQEHVMQFFMAELATEVLLDSHQQLIMKGRFNQRQIDSVIKKYYIEYVTCNNCKSSNTTLTSELATKLYLFVCTDCQTRRLVVPIKTCF